MMPKDSISLLPGVELLDSMRSAGYSFEAAVADLLDNSITAGARNVCIQADITNASYLYVLDDGVGMESNTALEALRLAGTATKSRANETDLGRFGLGMKTASLSQASKLTLITKKGTEIAAYCWDIKHLRESQNWEVLRITGIKLAQMPGISRLRSQKSGTLIVWEDLDYLLGKADNKSEHLGGKLAQLEQHLGFVFHRFIQGEVPNRAEPLDIFVNDNHVEATDPFLQKHVKTQVSKPYNFKVAESHVVVRGYTLPHQRYLGHKLQSRFDLDRNMRDYQGFYIYRNHRLISWGQWFGLAKKEELNKQSRISVDITSALDSLWQIDIRKSRSEPPYEFKQQLKPVMESIVNRSKRVHTFRGRKISAQNIQHYWNVFKKDKEVRYEINTNHPAIDNFISALGGGQRREFIALLKDISRFLPYTDIYVEKAKNSNLEFDSLPEDEYVSRIIKLKEMGIVSGKAIEIARLLSAVEPFSLITPLKKLQDLTEKALEGNE